MPPKVTTTTTPETTAPEAVVDTTTAFVAEPEQTIAPALDEQGRKLALLATLTQQSSTITWENVGTNGVDGEMYVQLRITPAAYELLRSVVVTLRTEFQNAQ